MFRDRTLKYLLVLPALIIILLVMFYPIAYAVYTSFYSYLYGRITNYVGLMNWSLAFQDSFFWHSILITLIYSVIAIPIELVISLALAISLFELENHISKKFITIIRSVVIVPFVVMPTVTGVIWRLIFMPNFGLASEIFEILHLPNIDWLGQSTNSMIAVIIMDIWMWVPFLFIILYAAVQSLPMEAFEAALVDGASRMQLVRMVILPLLKSSMLVAISLRSIDAIRIFDQVYAMTQGGPGDATMFASLQLSNTAFGQLNFGVAATELFITFVIMLLIVGSYYLIGIRRSANVQIK